MFGLLGPNGAGKSTLMRTIATLQDRDSGRIVFGELDVLNNKDEVRRVLGYLPQEFGVYPRISAEAMLDHLAVLKGITDRKERRERVLENPRLIIVDEPTAGLDPAERLRFHNLRSEIGEDRVVILSTHIVEDVSDLCSRMAVISKRCLRRYGGGLSSRGPHPLPRETPARGERAFDRGSRRGRAAESGSRSVQQAHRPQPRGQRDRRRPIPR